MATDDVIKLQLINAALTGVGDTPRATLASGSDNATPLEMNYDFIVEAALTSGPEFRFATKTTDMSSLLIGARADGIFDYEYTLPPDNLEVKAVLRSYGSSDPYVITTWEIEESKLLVDYNTGILLRHIFRAGESSWHPNFRLGVIELLTAVAERAFWENENAAQSVKLMAASIFGVAARASGHKRNIESRSIRRRRYGRT